MATDQLSRQIAEHRKMKEHEQGKPVAFPDKLDPKFLEPALLKNLNEAFEQTGVAGDVSFVDCDEYPCIVCADLEPGEGGEDLDNPIELIEKVRGADALSTYDGAKQQNTVFTRQKKSGDKEERSMGTCMSFYR